MPVPTYEAMMLPLLRFASDGQEHRLQEAIAAIAQAMGLSQKDTKEMYPSGKGPVFAHRVRWAKTYLYHAGLLSSPGRGLLKITEHGIGLLKRKPASVDEKVLRQFPEFQEFKQRRKPAPGSEQELALTDITPEDSIEQGYREVRHSLELELLQRVKECSPTFFEVLVVDLLVAMGYGGSRKDAGAAIGGSGDGGVDGIIKEDKLGLDVVYVQAKRWDSAVVGRPEIQKFVGALVGKRARKGVFITTSSFSQDALDYASAIESKVVLIDGEQLASHMVDHSLGVSTVAVYEMKKVDSDYFAEG